MSADLHNLQTKKNIGKAKNLLNSLVPREQCLCFSEEHRQCIWSNDGADEYEIDNFIADLPDEIITELKSEGNCFRRKLTFGSKIIFLSV